MDIDRKRHFQQLVMPMPVNLCLEVDSGRITVEHDLLGNFRVMIRPDHTQDSPQRTVLNQIACF
ncbi:hypothetical protein D3C75_594860 [compost metagenome]